MGVSGQPSVSAIGRHMAKPSGAYTVGWQASLAMALPSRRCQVSSSWATQEPSPGLQATGCKEPPKIAFMEPPEVTWSTSTTIRRPEAERRRSRLNAAATSLSQLRLVFDEATSTRSLRGLAAGSLPVPAGAGPRPRLKMKMMATAAARISRKVVWVRDNRMVSSGAPQRRSR